MTDDAPNPRLYATVSTPSPSMTDGDIADLLALKRRLDLERARLDAALVESLRAQHAERVRAGEPEVVTAVVVYAPIEATVPWGPVGRVDWTPDGLHLRPTLFVAPGLLNAVTVRRSLTGAERLACLPIDVIETEVLPVTAPPRPLLAGDDGEGGA